MNFDPKHVRRALMVAKNLATSIDPGFANIQPPMPPEGVPLERAKGGQIKTIEGADRERNLAEFMRDAHNSMLDFNGSPKVFYHGTSADFKKFKLSKTGSYGKGIYLTPSYEDAAEYTDPRQGSVYPVYVSIKNPYKVDFADHWTELYDQVTGKTPRNTDDEHPSYSQSKEIFDNLKERGFDGIEVQNAIWHEPNFGESHFIAFDPRQIKSAVGNVGAFDSSSPDITKAEGGIVDDGKSIRRALMIAKADGGLTEDAQPTKGLPFPEEDTAFRLRTKLNREAKVAAGKADPGLPSNPRMVIRAPKAKDGETQLPNFIVGPLTHKDWIARHEKILSPEEIQHSSQWYKNIYGNFLQYTNNNEPEAKKLMRAWLVAQQNVSPAGAMQNVLLQREQMQRGVPEPLWRAGGMPNPTNAARSVLRDQPISGGVGQKISDFVDSAEGLDTRSYLGHDPRGGSPFVIDVHSARDAGLVDPALVNHLRNLGYNENDLAKVQTDFEASPSDAQYENRAQWGRDLTKYLNKIGWQGKKDWRPEEIQAVGWMGMTKLTRNAEEDSASGLGRNLRRISFELSPGEGSPWSQKYGAAFESLPDEERYGITQKMSNRAMQIASELSGVNPLGTVHGTGAWMQYQNPAAVGQALATQGGADIMANTIGHLLHQTEVWHNRIKPVTSSPKGFAVDFIESGSQNLADRGQLRDFWQKITDADKTGLIQGYQPITLPNGQVGVRALVDKGGLGTHKKLTETLQEGGDLDKMLKELPFNVESQIAEAEITKARNDWKENQNGQAYLQRLSDLMGSDPSARLSAYGSQLEKELEGHLDEAYARQGRSWRSTASQGQQTQVEAPEKPPLPTMAYGGAIDRALQIASRART